ncbi:cobalt/nickel transport system permease protein [Desulfonatronum thiosulfatophilum]|uniref:Cobalt/nickel transport system permease protein n=1 Tax=Desulfonatronum thiosulfatophilum TaxID=617002 RepID=A0A1G6AHS6_9BACT|nr:cobalt transporter CbiM [Desulfonatronum thiosulfatophilum]SDB07889.1 cobalt/nickel transport system permease protein [Desulfonatronum thiosulfatophilum]
MHIPDGILPLPVTLGGYAVSVSIAWLCIRKIKQREDPREDIPKAALLTAAFFVASLIHIPIPPASVHLVLNGLLGALLGPFAFPAILIGLFFQAVMFGHGGLTTLGVNGIILGLPALAAYAIFHLRKGHSRTAGPRKTAVFGFLAAFTAICLSVLIFSMILFTNMPAHLSAEAERTAITALVLAHIPLALLEGTLTALLAVFLLRASPAILEGV